MVSFELSLEYVIVALHFFNISEPPKVLILTLLFCLLTNINFLFSISCFKMQNKMIQVELIVCFNVVFFL